MRAARGDWTWEMHIFFFVGNAVGTFCMWILFLFPVCDVSFLF